MDHDRLRFDFQSICVYPNGANGFVNPIFIFFSEVSIMMGGIFLEGVPMSSGKEDKKKGKTVSLWLSQEDMDFLEEIAVSIRMSEGRNVSRSEVVRRLIHNWRKQKLGNGL